MTVESTASIKQSDSNSKATAPLCKHKGCKCPAEENSQYCGQSCAAPKPVAQNYCPCEHDCCYRECDLVMKGGITSGIVYPPLVYKLHEDNYRFRNIGGTSAGAIMAALTAAAEHGRETGGFEKLNKLKEQLGKGTFLRDLFQPSKETRPLYNFLLSSAEVAKGEGKSAKGKGTFTKIWQLAGKFQRASPVRFISAFLVGTLAGLGIAYLLILILSNGVVTNGGGLVLFVFGLLGALAGYLVAFGMGGHRLFKILTRKIPDNYFGMCTGLKDDSTPQEALTNWLNESINALANPPDKKMPLTFGMLKKKTFVKQLKGENGIELRMMTCNVSQNQPYVLPFTNQLLIYNEAEFRDFFPAEVLEYMKEKSPQRPSYNLSRIPGYFFLPAANDLPVIVATRLSLSFPLLLCALPLYTIVPNVVVTDETKLCVYLEKGDLKLNWFSDGGIASNFPIQFFDAWLPMRPSFGINLTSLPEEGFEKEDIGLMERVDHKRVEKKKLRDEYNSPTANPTSPEARQVTGKMPTTTAGRIINKNAIYLPAADDPLFTEWLPLTTKAAKGDEEVPSLLKFVWSIFTTAQNYRDNMQAMLPSYRERIVQIRLSEDEGGLNLVMPRETINEVMRKGEEAGRLLLEDFDFGVHQWIRFQVLMIQMEKYLLKALEVAGEDPNTKTRLFDYEALMKNQRENGYPWGQIDDWCKHADKRMKDMGELLKHWKEFKLGDKPPLPESALRVMPEI